MLSSSTATIDRVKKVPIYTRERVGFVWLVDSRDRTIEVQRPGAVGYEGVGTWAGDDGPFALEPFDAVPLPPAAFWGRELQASESGRSTSASANVHGSPVKPSAEARTTV